VNNEMKVESHKLNDLKSGFERFIKETKAETDKIKNETFKSIL